MNTFVEAGDFRRHFKGLSVTAAAALGQHPALLAAVMVLWQCGRGGAVVLGR